MTSLMATCVIAILATARPVVVTTDCGAEVDDQWALAHLALSPEIALKAVVTTHAPSLKPPAAASSAKAAREVFTRMKIAEPPPIVMLKPAQSPSVTQPHTPEMQREPAVPSGGMPHTAHQ